MRRRSFLTTLVLVTAPLACKGEDTRTPEPTPEVSGAIFIVRHAEKELGTGDDDPPLTVAGEARARALVEAIDVDRLDHIISSEYRRTQATVAPVADAAGLEIEIIPAADAEALLARLEALHDQRVLVSGHSNTIPPLLQRLGVAAKKIEDDRYGDLFIVTGAPGARSLELRRFDAPPSAP